MNGKEQEIHNILVALLSGQEEEIYNVLYKKKEIDDKTPILTAVGALHPALHQNSA